MIVHRVGIAGGFLAYTTKGLEQVSANEVKHLLAGVQIEEIRAKRVLFETAAEPAKLTQLKTVDDIGVLVGRTKASGLEEVITFAATLNFDKTDALIKQIRDTGGSFSITVTLARVQGYKSLKLTEQLHKVIREKTGRVFSKTERSKFDIRVFIDHDEVYFSVRLTEDSLHNRLYKTSSKEGSLKSTIAASMVQLVCNWKTNFKVVDNFCGSGTILAEAVMVGNQAYGGDIDPESVLITIKNLSNLGYKAGDKVRTLNAISTHWPNNFFDCAISNLPWGKQVEIESITNLYIGTIKEYQRILKPNGKLCLIVSNPEMLVKYAKQSFPKAKIETIKIGYLGQSPTIVLIG